MGAKQFVRLKHACLVLACLDYPEVFLDVWSGRSICHDMPASIIKWVLFRVEILIRVNVMCGMDFE